MAERVADPAGWNRIKELEDRITEAVLEVEHRRELAPGNPGMATILDAIEAPLLGWDKSDA